MSPIRINRTRSRAKPARSYSTKPVSLCFGVQVWV